ncbi:von Willebrand factor type A domain protein [Teladorsagia circumcincta]|uniref:von Willebrand factor type A domain protein n=1 Tax=Teladorsagia circumcincta TaxID=45464 RepID=A0A2G9UQ98_TELCI|nr:von Willebrand factor type A domain protein [Teladorsagia circumcincta]
MHRLPLVTCLLLCLLSLSCRAQYSSSITWDGTTTSYGSTTEGTTSESTSTTLPPSSTAMHKSSKSTMDWTTSTTPSSTTPGSTSTGPVSTTPSWISSTVAPSQIVDQCKCTDKNIWLDIYFLMDASYAMTSPGFDGATAFIQSVLSKMTLGQDNAQQTRAGFIVYGATATVQYSLTQWTSTMDMLLNMNLPYSGSRGTNIEAAIKLASDRFNSAEHRPNAQKVIVIVASAYESGTYTDPSKVADTFKRTVVSLLQ